MKAVCKACEAELLVPRLDVACRQCGERQLTKPRRAKKHKPVRKLPPISPERLAAMPPKLRKLREFMTAEGFSEPGLAKHLNTLGHKCSQGYIGKVLRQERSCNWEIARAIANMMRRRGYSPCELYPGAAFQGRRQVRRRRDHRRWGKKHDTT